MERRKLGKTDMQVSALGFGGSEIGYQSVAPSTVKKMLNSALDAEVNVIDTAECYVNSEELIGQAVAARSVTLRVRLSAGLASWFAPLIATSCGAPR